MPAQFWSPDDWQLAVNLWLTARYGLGSYQKVPDRHVGDFGIEGFSTDGNAYQSYAPEALTTAKDLYEKQRDKMTADINKFRAADPNASRSAASSDRGRAGAALQRSRRQGGLEESDGRG